MTTTNTYFSVYYTNHFYGPGVEFPTADDAIRYGKGRGFEFTVNEVDRETGRERLVAGWSHFRGLNAY